MLLSISVQQGSQLVSPGQQLLLFRTDRLNLLIDVADNDVAFVDDFLGGLHQVVAAAEEREYHQNSDAGDSHQQWLAGIVATVERIVREEIPMWFIIQWIVLLLVMKGIVEHISVERIEGFASHMTERIGVVHLSWEGIGVAVYRHKLIGLYWQFGCTLL